MDIRELFMILLVTALGVGFIWFETGRDRALLKTGIVILCSFLLLGSVAVALT